MAGRGSRYAGQRVSLLTQQGNERAIAPVLGSSRTKTRVQNPGQSAMALP